jgi:ribosomal protein L40E
MTSSTSWIEVSRDIEVVSRPVRIAIVCVALATAVPALVKLLSGRYGSWVFLVGTAVALLFAVAALWRAASALFVDAPETERVVQTGRRRKELEREKAAVMKALKELEFDHEMRKISDSDFVEIGGLYRARAIRILRQLDDRQVDYARLVEEELTRRTARPREAAAPKEAAAPVATPAAKPAMSSHDLQRCARCGTTNDPDASFCKKCAAALKEAV